MSPKRERSKVTIEPSVVEEITKATLSKKEREEAQRVRVYYDVPAWLKLAGERAAEREQTTASQMGAFLLAWAQKLYWEEDESLLKALANSKENSRSLRIVWNVGIPPAVERAITDRAI